MMRWVMHGREQKYTAWFWLESLRERNSLGDKGVGGREMLKCTLKIRNGSAWSDWFKHRIRTINWFL